MDSVDSIFSNFCNVSKRLQTFKTQLQNSKVSNETRLKCHRELEQIQTLSGEVLQTAQAAGSAVAGQLAAMNQEIISTYSEIENRFEDYEVSLIAKDALDLGTLLEKGQMTQVAAAVDKLKGRIQFLSENRRPSLQSNKIIHLANKMAQQAILPHAERAKLYSLKLVQMLRSMIEETMTQTEELLFPEEAELIMELYEIADLFAHHHLNDARRRLRPLLDCLPKHAQKCMDELDSEKCAQLLIDIAQGFGQERAPQLAAIESPV